MRPRNLAALLALAAGAALAVWWYVRGRNVKVAIAESLRATLPDRISRWADPIASAAVSSAPGDFPGGAPAWAVYCCSVMEEESQGGRASGYMPRDDWNGTGDRGNAFTPWQLDKHYHAAYLARTDRTPETDSVYAMKLLRDNWSHFSDVADTELRQKATVAAYNASRSRVQAALDAGRDPDSVTYPRAGGQVYASEIVERFGNWSPA